MNEKELLTKLLNQMLETKKTMDQLKDLGFQCTTDICMCSRSTVLFLEGIEDAINILADDIETVDDSELALRAYFKSECKYSNIKLTEIKGDSDGKLLKRGEFSGS